MIYRLFFTSESNENSIFHYFLGFQPSSGWLVVEETEEELIIDCFLDERYSARTLLISNEELYKKCKKNVQISICKRDKSVEQLLLKYGSVQFIIEKSLSYAVYEYLSEYCALSFEKSSRGNALRIVKSQWEQQQIQEAIDKTHLLRDWVKQNHQKFLGMSEIAVRGMLVKEALALGLEGEAFPTIVASGINSAIPHHETSRDSIGQGPLLIDMGRKWNGYCSDMTRCFWIGEESDLYTKRLKTLNHVKKAHSLGIRLSTSGSTTGEVAGKVREYFQEQGLEDYFTHALGHGVGIDVHELPRVGKNAEDVLKEGMVITIEPGIYFTGQFGIRWEDTIIVANG